MPELNEVVHDGPIAGQSLTAEYGARPWQSPPQYSTLEEALDWYIPKLTDKAFTSELFDIIEMGIPLTTIANSMQLTDDKPISVPGMDEEVAEVEEEEQQPSGLMARRA